MITIFSRVKNKIKNSLKTPKERLAEKRHSLVGSSKFWKMKRKFQISFLKSVGLQAEHYLLDIGCGTLRGGIPLIEYLNEGHYFGIEARTEALEEGRKELREFNLESKMPVLMCTTDIISSEIKQKFDFIWAFSVLIHMNDQILDDCFHFVGKNLAENGHFYANVIISKNLANDTKKAGDWYDFPVMVRKIEFYQQISSRHGLSMSELGTLQSLGHNSGAVGQDKQIMLEFGKS